jgi:hypothetical protein
MKKTITVICLSAFLFAAQSQSASADNVQAMSGNQGQQKDTKGSHCSFSRAEKIGMLLWIVPFAGAVYTPLHASGKCSAPKGLTKTRPRPNRPPRRRGSIELANLGWAKPLRRTRRLSFIQPQRVHPAGTVVANSRATV